MSVSTVQNVSTGDKTKPGFHLHWQTMLLWGIVFALILIAVGMRLYQIGLPFDRDSYDEGVYWQSLRAMGAGHALYQQIFYSQPPFFLLSTFPGYLLFGSTLWSARLGIALVSLLGLLGAYVLGKALSGRLGALAALLLLIVDPLYLAQSQTIQAEASSVAFSLLAVGFAYLWWEQPEGRKGLCWAAFTGVTFALSVLCKFLTVATILPIALLMLTRLWQIRGTAIQPSRVAATQPPPRVPARGTPTILPVNRSSGSVVYGRGTPRGYPGRWLGGGGGGLRPILAGIAACLITVLLVLLPFVGSYATVIQSVITFHTEAGNVLGNTQQGNLAIIQPAFMSLLALTAFYGTIAALIRRDWRVLPLIAWLLGTLYVLWHQVPLFTHHLVALTPPLVALAVMGLNNLSVGARLIAPSVQFGSDESVSNGLRGAINRAPTDRATASFVKYMPWIALVLVLLTVGLDIRQDRQYYRVAMARGVDGLEQQEMRVAADLRSAITADQWVVTDAQFVAGLADRNTPPALVDTSAVRINTGYLQVQQLIDAASAPQVYAVLFFTGRFLLPKVAAFHTWVAQHFHLLHSYGGGQELWVL